MHLPDPFACHRIITDKKGCATDYVFLEANPAFSAMTGMPKEKLVGRKATEVFPGIKQAKFDWIGTFGQIALNGKTICFKQYFDPLCRWCQVTAYSSKRGYFSAVFQNSGEPEKTKAAPAQNGKLHHTLFEESVHGMYIASPQGKFMDVNTALVMMLGYEQKQELLALNLYKDVYATKQKDLLSVPKKGIYEVPFKKKDGTTLDAELSLDVLYEQHRPVVFRGMVKDISKSKQPQEALRTEGEKYKRLYETMAHGVIHQDAEDKIISANPAAEKILGRTLDQMGGKTSLDPGWKSIDEQGKEVQGSEHPSMVALRTGKSVGPIVLGVYNPRIDDRVWISIHATPLFHPKQKKPFQTYITFDDISAKRKAELALKGQLQFEKLVADISSIFINLPTDQIDDGINLALQLTGEFFQVGRSYLFEVLPQQKMMHNTHEWCAKGIEPQKPNRTHIPLHHFSWCKKQMDQLGVLHIPDTQRLPCEAHAVKKVFDRQSIQSLLAIPVINVEKEIYGFFGFDSVKEKKHWTEREITLLKVVAETIFGALVKYELEQGTRMAHQRMLKVLDSMDAVVYVADINTYEILFINRHGEEIWGGVLGEKCWQKLQKGQSGPCDFCTNNKILDTEGRPKGIHQWEHFNAKTRRWYDCRAQAMRWVDGRMVRMETAVDITESKETEEKIRYMSFHDSLTGLYNRAYMETEMRRLDTKRQMPLSIIMADLNGLKLVNDTHGHATGDRMLKKAASIMEQCCRKEDIIARWGGDEFVVLLPQTAKEAADRLCKRIQTGLSQASFNNIPISAALGKATKRRSGKNMEQILKDAEDRMYSQKLAENSTARKAIIKAFLNMMEEKNIEPKSHIESMQKLASKMGRSLSLLPSEQDRLRLLVRLHDIGKINISEKIIAKKGPLSAKEWKAVQAHTQIGYKIAMATPEFSMLSEEILSHHEHWDGSGYPQGLHKNQIPRLSRILAIVDAYVVMRQGKPYQKPLSEQDAIAEIKQCAGSHFDPDLARIFLSIL